MRSKEIRWIQTTQNKHKASSDLISADRVPSVAAVFIPVVICHHFLVLDAASDDQPALNNEQSEKNTHGTFK